jgi:hypothetical protein
MNPTHTYQNSLVVKMSISAEEIQERFPHVVHHAVQFPSDKWRHMVKWLRVTVGEPEQSWAWLRSSQIMFQHESDAMLFSITWS